MKNLIIFFWGLLSVVPCWAQQEEDMTSYIVNAGFDRDLTWNADGSKKGDMVRETTLSDRSIAYVTEDGSLYATINPTTPKSRPDGRTFEAINGFVGQINGWEWVTPRVNDGCEWVYFGTLPYDLENEAIPVADDGSGYIIVPERSEDFDAGTGYLYMRAGWGGTFSYKQEVKLPCAQYRLEYWTININPNTSGSATDLTKITCRRDVFREEGGEALASTEWTKHEFEFTPVDKFTIEFGIQVSNNSSNATPWMVIDGIKLYKIDDADPAEVLRSDLYYYTDELLANLPDSLMGVDGEYFYGLIDEAEALQEEYFYDGDDVEQLKAAIENLKGLYEGMLEAAQTARRLESLYAYAIKLLETTDDYPGYEALASYCENVYGQLYETANAEAIRAMEAELQQALSTYEQSNMTSYIVNAGFDEDLTWNVDGSKKGDLVRETTLSDRSIAYVTEDGSLYATVNPTTSKSRPDGRTYEATNGFVGQINGWEWVTPRVNDGCEWVYFGTLPYDLEDEAIPVADDGSSYIIVPERSDDFNGGTGYLYMRAGWGGSFSYKQEVKLPCAQYRMEYWTRNINPNTSGSAADLTKITCRHDVFREEGGAALAATEWTKHEFEFTPVDKFTIEFGIQVSNNSSNTTPWMVIDGIKLYKIGDADPMELLRSDLYYYVEEALPSLPDSLIGVDGEPFFGLIDEAEALQEEYYYDGDDFEQLKAAVENLRGLYEGMLEAAQTARHIEALYAYALELLDTTEYPGYEALASYCDNMDGQLYETANAEAIKAMETELQQAINTYLQSNMPNEGVPGDANLDGTVDVVDVTTTVDFILQKAYPTDEQFLNTDVNKDGTIDVVDLTSVVSIILGTYQPAAAPHKARVKAAEQIQSDDVLMIDGTDVALKNTIPYVAFQMDVTLADGATLNDVILSERATDHTTGKNKLSEEENKYRILVYSLTSTPIAGNDGVLLSLKITGNQHFEISNIKFTDESLTSYTLNVKDITKVNDLVADPSKVISYDLNGRPSNTTQKHGIHVIDGKKVIVK